MHTTSASEAARRQEHKPFRRRSFQVLSPPLQMSDGTPASVASSTSAAARRAAAEAYRRQEQPLSPSVESWAAHAEAADVLLTAAQQPQQPQPQQQQQQQQQQQADIGRRDEKDDLAMKLLLLDFMRVVEDARHVVPRCRRAGCGPDGVTAPGLMPWTQLRRRRMVEALMKGLGELAESTRELFDLEEAVRCGPGGAAAHEVASRARALCEAAPGQRAAQEQVLGKVEWFGEVGDDELALGHAGAVVVAAAVAASPVSAASAAARPAPHGGGSGAVGGLPGSNATVTAAAAAAAAVSASASPWRPVSTLPYAPAASSRAASLEAFLDVVEARRRKKEQEAQGWQQQQQQGGDSSAPAGAAGGSACAVAAVEEVPVASAALAAAAASAAAGSPLPPALDVRELGIESDLLALDGQRAQQQWEEEERQRRRQQQQQQQQQQAGGEAAEAHYRTRPPPDLEADLDVARALRRAERASMSSAELRSAMAARSALQTTTATTTTRPDDVFSGSAAAAGGAERERRRSPSSLMNPTASSRLKRRSPPPPPSAGAAAAVAESKTVVAARPNVQPGGRAGALRALEVHRTRVAPAALMSSTLPFSPDIPLAGAAVFLVDDQQRRDDVDDHK